jgi:DnaK suppressor protein
VKAPAKPAKTAQKSKTPVKAAAKPVGKAVAKAAVKAKPKTVARPVVKAVVKSAPKPVAKKTAKPAAAKKPVSKAPVKPAAKKPAVKATPAAKPAPKKPAVPVKAAVKTPAKPAPKAAATPEKPAVSVKVVVPAPVPVVRPPEKSSQLPPPPPLKPGRRSSARAHAQMPPPAPMVPTHAPDAAKASYSTMTERVIAPPPHVAAKKDPKLANNWKTKSGDTLTDDEVKAMPDSEYMNDKQMAFFRHKLSILKQDIHNSAGETTEHLREDTVVVPDPADRATIEEEHALELRTRDRERKLLKKIEQSIARIDSGDYGYCDETGEPIGVGRLIARPTANLSLEAQQRRELKQKMFGD